MARALECPACGHRHRLDGIPDGDTFRCEQCGQVLKAPSPVSSQPGAPPPPARGSGPPASTGAPAPVAPPPRRTATAPTDDGATRAAPVRTAAGVSATVAATAAAEPTNGAAAPAEQRTRRSRSAPPAPAARAPRTKVHWYWRLLAWIVAVPLAFVVTAWPAYKFGFIEKDDLLDIFVGTGIGRYVRLGIVTLVWAVVTALLVQLFVEGGRARANRRRRTRAAAA